MSAAPPALRGKRVLVTGATGFIGGRLVERLFLEGVTDVRVVVSNFTRCARVARFPVDIVRTDLLDVGALAHAMHDVHVVLHCAYGSHGSRAQRERVNVDGARNIFEAALKLRTPRVVHVSTLEVYGDTPPGDIDETAPRRASGSYARSKLEAETLALDYAGRRGLPVAVVQPTVVYGPFAPVWATGVLQKLRTGRAILVNGGDGICNAVYVDDVVDALLLAAVTDDAVGQTFLISGEKPVTWLEFYGRYERMLGVSRTVSLSAVEASALHARAHARRSVVGEMVSILREEQNVRRRIRQTAEVQTVMNVLRWLRPARERRSSEPAAGRVALPKWPLPPSHDEPPIHLLSPAEIQLYARKTRVSIDKAARLLGYRPRFDLDGGMELTQRWARWANMLG